MNLERLVLEIKEVRSSLRQADFPIRKLFAFKKVVWIASTHQNIGYESVEMLNCRVNANRTIHEFSHKHFA